MELKIEKDEGSDSRIVAVPSRENGIFVVESSTGMRAYERIVIEGMAKRRVTAAIHSGDTSELKVRYFETTPQFPNFIALNGCRGVVSVFMESKGYEHRYISRMNEYDPHDHFAEPQP